MVPAVRSTLDVALWLLARAESAGEHLQPQKLQRLLYVAHAHYAGDHNAKLMPATFLATKLGPVEPNIYHLFEGGTPRARMADPAPEVEQFLMAVWDRYGKRSADELLVAIRTDGAFTLALKRGHDNEIPHELLAAGYGGERGGSQRIRPAAKPDAEPGYWTQTGKRATKWIPRQGKAARSKTARS